MKLKKTALGRARILFVFCLANLITISANAENIRGRTAGVLDSDGIDINFRPEELIVIELGSVPDFQEGMEIHIEIPEALRRYQNSFALLLFRDIAPLPTEENRNYGGTRTYMRLLPSRNSTFLRIPFTEDHGIAGDALTDVLPVSIEADQFPLILTVLPVMKGIPDSAFLEDLTIRAVSLWKNEGSLTIGITNPSGFPDEIVEIMVNGDEVIMDEALTLDSGIHRIRITSTHAPTIEKTIAIEPGQELVFNFSLDYRPPELTVNIPDGATILLDGEAIDTGTDIAVLETTPGDHIITYSLGNLEVNRSFTVRPGGKVRIDLVIEIGIVEYGDGAGSEYGAGDG